MTALADEEQRQQALDPRRSFIVQAPAGAGKTALLVQRFLRLLANAETPEEIVAITFTRKAAAEMRHRIITALSSQQRAENRYQEHNNRLAEKARQQDQKKQWQLLKSPARLRILTIDSLCHQVALQLPLRAGRMAADITPQPELAYQQAAQRCLDDIANADLAEGAIVLAQLDNNPQRLQRLLTAALQQREHWLRHCFADQSTTATVYQTLLQQLLTTLQQRLPTSCDWPPATNSALPAWCALAAQMLTRDGHWRQRGIGDDKLAAALAVCRQYPPGQQRDLQQRLGLLQAMPTHCEQSAASAPLIRLLRQAAAHLELIFQEQGHIDYVANTQQALQALGHDDQPSDFALALDYRINHLLVDEFQDTSHSHFALINRLIAGWHEGDGHSLFLVGDPMQSIYRFRDAEVAGFLQVWQHGIGALRLTPLSLSVNLRSEKRLLDWFNRYFPPLFPPHDEALSGAVTYRAVTARPQAADGAVQLHALPDDSSASEVACIARIIAATRAQGAAEILILVRTRGDGLPLLHGLQQSGYRPQAIDFDSLGQHPVVQDLLTLLRSILNPNDRIAWLALLRSPYCGLTLPDLLRIADDDKRTVPATLAAAAHSALSDDGQRRIQRLWDIWLPLWQHRQRGSLARQLRRAWLQLGGPACVTQASQLALAEAFFDCLQQQQGDWDADTLRQQLEQQRLPPDPDSDPHLQLMTIHKAKGLEADTVILARCGKVQVRHRQRSLLTTFDLPHNQGHLLAPMATSDKQPCLATLLHQIEGIRQHNDLCRLLYVALTRARKSLHITAHAAVKGQPRRGSLLELLWPAFDTASDEAAAETAIAETSTKAAISQHIWRLDSDWKMPATQPFVPAAELLQDEPQPALDFIWAGPLASQLGNVIHLYLCRIGREGLDQWPAQRLHKETEKALLRQQLRQQGITTEEALTAALQQALTTLDKALRSRHGRFVFDPRHGDAHSEWPISGFLDNHLHHVIIDRCFTDQQGQRWVVDFKTSAHSGGATADFLDSEQQRYRPQLQRYAALLGATAQQPFQLALYYPLLDGWRQWQWPHAPQQQSRDL